MPLLRHVPRRTLGVYLIATLLAGLLFSFCLKWQYWGIRLQLPWLLLMMPLCATVLFRIRLPQRVRVLVRMAIAFLLFFGALPALLFDSDLPLWETTKPPLMFRDAESVRFGAAKARFKGESEYSKVVEFLRPFDPEDVGLMLPKGNACHDYNWWVMFGTHARPGRPRIRHVGPDVWPVPDTPPPEWIIKRGRQPDASTIMGARYKAVFEAGSCRVYRRELQMEVSPSSPSETRSPS